MRIWTGLSFLAAILVLPQLGVAAPAAAKSGYPQPYDARASSNYSGDYNALKVLDDSYTTFWHSAWENPENPYGNVPFIHLYFHEDQTVEGLDYTPRQYEPFTGNILQYAITAVIDGQSWVVATGTWEDDAYRSVKHAKFSVRTSQITLWAQKTNDPGFASAAEIDLIVAC